MKKWLRVLVLASAMATLSCHGSEPDLGLQVSVKQQAAGYPWRSILYPQNWTPGYTHSSGHFLHDFSYAGYHLGEEQPGTVQSSIFIDVVEDFGADPTGATDTTAQLQAAIDQAELTGGVVFLPEGTYKVAPPTEGSKQSLLIDKSGVIVRGAGPGKTRLYNSTTSMRNKAVIRVKSSAIWRPVNEIDSVDIVSDVANQATEVLVENASQYAVGDWIVLRSNATEEFLDQFPRAWMYPETPDGEARTADASLQVGGITFYRQITSISGNEITIDIPTRYPIKVNHDARIYRIASHIEEIGLEDFSIGMQQFNQTYLPENAHEPDQHGGVYAGVHRASAVWIEGVVNSWIHRVASYRPLNNDDDFHLLSQGLTVQNSRSLEVADCTFSKPQFIGPSGNGYMFRLFSSDSLYRDNVAIDGRHNYSLLDIEATGNVLLRNRAENGFFASDLHHRLSLANLVDSNIMDGDYWRANYRGYHPANGPGSHGPTTTQTVFWNTKSLGFMSTRRRQNGWMVPPTDPSRGCTQESTASACVVNSRQHGDGYVIGTSGAVPDVEFQDRDLCRYRGLPEEVANLETFEKHPNTPGAWTPYWTKYYCDVGGRIDLIEGEGIGDSLEPQSLYLAQLMRRAPNAPLPPPADIRVGPWGVASSGAPLAEVQWTHTTGAASYVLKAGVSPDSMGFIGEIPASVGVLLSGFTHEYETVYVQIAAKNAAGTVGPDSEPIALSPVVGIYPTDDATVRNQSFANTNFGSSTTLLVNIDSQSSALSELRFDLSQFAEPLAHAVLHLQVNNAGATNQGIEVFSTLSDTWSENTITWNNPNPLLPGEIAEVQGVLASGKTIQLDMTAVVNEAILSDGILSIALRPRIGGDNTFVLFHSKESSLVSARPQLLLKRSARVISGADSYVRGGAYANQNYGSETRLVVKQDPNTSYDRYSILRFEFSGRTTPFSQLKLRMTPKKVGSTAGDNYLVWIKDETDWNESTVTWNNQPDLDPGVEGILTNLEVGLPVDVDLTDLANRSLENGRPLSLHISSEDSGSQGFVEYHSREWGIPYQRPQVLVID